MCFGVHERSDSSLWYDTHYNPWDEITYLFQNFNGATVELLEWICNSIPHFIGYMNTYFMLVWKLIRVI